jgi:hypothetical protein
MSGERIFIYLFVASLAVCGVIGLIAPQRFLQTKGDWWFFDWMTGRMMYSSIRRVRVSCGLLLLMALFCVFVMLFDAS